MNRLASKVLLIRRFPVIDLGRCSECHGCTEVAPDVFRYNKDAGIMEVIEQQNYPEELVNEAIKNCPKDCIIWENVELELDEE